MFVQCYISKMVSFSLVPIAPMCRRILSEESFVQTVACLQQICFHLWDKCAMFVFIRQNLMYKNWTG